MAADLYRYFRIEARDLLDQCAGRVLELEKGGPGEALVQRLLRLTHTLKGAARVVRQTEIADRTHAIEEALDPFRGSGTRITDDAIGTILAHLDHIGQRLLMLGPADPPVAPLSELPPPPAVKPLSSEAAPVVWADVGEIDTVLDGLAETHALLTGLRDVARGTEKVRRLAGMVTRLAARTPDIEAPERILAIAGDLHREAGGVERGLSLAIDRMDRELHQVRTTTEQLRLARAASLFTGLERTARDAARALGKQVRFDATGGELRLDSRVLGAVRNAIVQLVRNAVAHGIELPGDRLRAGKPETGRIAVRVSRRGDRVLFECEDDGGGLDLEAIRRVVARRGLAGPEAKSADAATLIRLLLQGGITTSEAVTEISGRGIGLDVVRETIETLGGEVAVRTRPGQGSVFTLRVPPLLSALDALIVEAGESGAVAIPLDAVRGTIRAAADQILGAAPNGTSGDASGAAIIFEQRAIGFASLAVVLGGEVRPLSRAWSVVVLAGRGGVAAIGVDRLLGTATIVVRPVPDQLGASPRIAGVALDTAGNIQLVLDPDEIVDAARHGASARTRPVPARRPVLVIDDSATTRMLEQSILEAAGYEVDVAASAEDGLKAARTRRYALFLVDVEMPGMDGFAFVEQAGADPVLRDIPAILVTSRAAPEDIRRGRAAGARGYIDKSHFDQSELLELIKPLVG